MPDTGNYTSTYPNVSIDSCSANERSPATLGKHMREIPTYVTPVSNAMFV